MAKRLHVLLQAADEVPELPTDWDAYKKNVQSITSQYDVSDRSLGLDANRLRDYLRQVTAGESRAIIEADRDHNFSGIFAWIKPRLHWMRKNLMGVTNVIEAIHAFPNHNYLKREKFLMAKTYNIPVSSNERLQNSYD